MIDESSHESRTITDPESAFMVLSHDLRLEILLALWDASGFSLSFSELRKAVDERDSGGFNYHLSKLLGHFVAETDDAAWDAVVDGVEHRIQNYLRWDDKEWSPEYLRRTREKGLFGSPETVTAELNRHDDELEDDIHWILWFSYPGVEKEQLIRSMELFVDEVVPQLDSQ